MNLFLCALGWIPGVVHAIYCAMRGPLLKKPSDITRFIVANFENISTSDYSNFEKVLAKSSPRSIERDLIYALRVSEVLPTIKSFKTLESRWATAHCGAGASGLELGRKSRNYRLVYEFLTKHYLNHAARLLETEHEKFRMKLEGAKTEKTKEKYRESRRTKLKEIRASFSYELLGLDELITDHISRA